jgi:hypothetical protein
MSSSVWKILRPHPQVHVIFAWLLGKFEMNAMRGSSKNKHAPPSVILGRIKYGANLLDLAGAKR